MPVFRFVGLDICCNVYHAYHSRDAELMIMTWKAILNELIRPVGQAI